MAENKKNTGAFFIADKKGNDKKPDYTGKVDADGTMLYLSSWKRKSKNDNTYYSLSFNVPNSDFSIKDPDIENNRGVLFENNKRDNDKAPDLTGKCKILGSHYQLSAWKKEKNDSHYFSLSLKKEDPDNQDHDHENYSQDNGNSYDQSNHHENLNQDFGDTDESSPSGFDIFTMGQ